MSSSGTRPRSRRVRSIAMGRLEEPEFLPFAVERRWIDAERFRRIVKIAGDGKNPTDVFGFECIKGYTGTDRDGRVRFHPELFGQIARLDNRAICEDHRPLDHIAQ